MGIILLAIGGTYPVNYPDLDNSELCEKKDRRVDYINAHDIPR
jgi:hypothetical protein